MLCGTCKERECPHGWTRCRRCSLDYQRKHREILLTRAAERGRREGIETFRAQVITVFEEYWPELELNGRGAADIVRAIRLGQ